MILGTKILLNLVKNQKLVEGLSQRELDHPEGAGFDLRLGEVLELSGKGFLGIDERKTPGVKSMAVFSEKKKSSFVFRPGKYYLVKTVEKLNLPENILALFRPRSTLYRSGVTVFTGNASPGYCGELNFGLVNLGSLGFKMELGARFAHVMFYEVKGEIVHSYRGQWQGGRTHAKKRERQI